MREKGQFIKLTQYCDTSWVRDWLAQSWSFYTFNKNSSKRKKKKKKTHELCKMLKNVTKYFYCSTTDENGIHLDETVLIHFGCCWWWWNFWKTKSENGLRLFIKRKNRFAFFLSSVNASINTHVWEFSLTHCNEAFEIMVQLVSIGSRQKIAQG